MNKNKELTHDGVVSRIEDQDAWVKIIAKSACAGCHAKGACSVADVEEKLVHIKRAPRGLEIGQKVVLVANKKQEKLALLLGYLLPLVVLILSLILFKQLDFSDSISAILTITILVPYYALLYIFRGRISNKLEFSIRKI
ncbi:SoxR reducing system RseC family protein [Halosquirtibacter xylanolyticus]|uniref:SoxR reducing system RseC family protein n=1 Tax=Halosquirtibacter xylanolyticus TaxID=3374599 RepID=UPI0037482D88|nr:SoxR reducing system RseC family protein [Prolixibacteraceae bacterium]